jgi:hypothetical protein
MGGGQSKSNKLDCLSDSNSVRQRHDEKVLRSQGVKNIGYVPRRHMEIDEDEIHNGSMAKDKDRIPDTIISNQ